MSMVAHALVILVALLHVGFLILEMFLWTKPIGLRVFRQPAEKAASSAALAANQGLYNGFLAGGLLWSALHPNPAFGAQLAMFFLACVMIAGLYGAYSVSRRILAVQAFPAALALIAVLIARPVF